MGRRWVVGALALGLWGCGAELKVGSRVGLRPIAGEARVPLVANPVCEQVDCKVAFSRTVVVATRREYAQLDGLLQAIELEVRRLSFTDTDRNEVLGLERLRHGSLTVAEQLTVTAEQLAVLPLTLRLDGPALEAFTAQMAAGEDAMLKVSAELVVTPPLPRSLLVRYDVRPILVLGPK